MAVLTSNTGSLMSGTFDITIDDSNISGTDTSFVLLNVGELNIKYDSQSSTTDTTGFKILVAEWSFRCLDECADGTLLSDKISIIPEAEPASCQIAYSDRGGTARNFRLQLGRDEYSLDQERGIITFTVRSLPSSYFASKETGNPSIDDIAGAYDYVTSDLGASSAIDAYSFIEDCLREIDRQLPESSTEPANTLVVDSLVRNSDATKDVIRDPALPDVGDDDFYVVSDSTDGGAYFLFARLAGLHGAVWGHGFGTSYFVCRINDDNKVTLSTTDYLENQLQKVTANPQYNDFTVQVQQTTISGTTTVQADSLNNILTSGYAENKDYNLSLRPDQLYLGEYNGNQPGGNIEIDNVSGSIIREDLIYAGLDSTLAARNAPLSEMTVISGSTGFNVIEVELIGVNTLYPWQTFDFDSSVPDQYQGITYRPAELKYNFEQDTVWCRAYAIRA